MEGNKNHFSKEEIERYYDKALSPDKAKALKDHLQNCTACSSYIESLKELSGVLQKSFSVAPEKDFARSVMQKISQKGTKEKGTKGIFENIFILFQKNRAVAALAASLLVILTGVFIKVNLTSDTGNCLVDYVHVPEGNALIYDAKDNVKVVWVFEEGVQ